MNNLVFLDEKKQTNPSIVCPSKATPAKNVGIAPPPHGRLAGVLHERGDGIRAHSTRYTPDPQRFGEPSRRVAEGVSCTSARTRRAHELCRKDDCGT